MKPINEKQSIFLILYELIFSIAFLMLVGIPKQRANPLPDPTGITPIFIFELTNSLLTSLTFHLPNSNYDVRSTRIAFFVKFFTSPFF